MPDSSERIAQLIREGRKIEAIKLLRETTGISLKRAKAEIDRLEGRLSAPTPRPEAQPDDGRALLREVDALIGQGRKIEAIKLLRERTGVGLKEAKQQVDAMSGGGRGGCLTVALLVVGLTSLLSALGA